MRKDVKFGLTIGGILVATIVVYVMVLSGGPDDTKITDSTTKPATPTAQNKTPDNKTVAGATGAGASGKPSPSASGAQGTGSRGSVAGANGASGNSGRGQGTGSGGLAGGPRTGFGGSPNGGGSPSGSPSPSGSGSPYASGYENRNRGGGGGYPSASGSPGAGSPSNLGNGSGSGNPATAPSAPIARSDSPRRFETPATRVSPPIISDSSSTGNSNTGPATHPSAGGSGNSSLAMGNSGTPPLMAAIEPERTVTPSPGQTSGRTPVIRGDSHPLIDGPSTAPAPSDTSHVTPPLYASSNPPIGAGNSGAPLINPPSLPPVTPNRSQISPPTPVVDVSPASHGQRTHVVAAHESLWTIAAAAYGNGSLYTKLQTANPGVTAKNLKIGMTLIIPELTAAEKTTASNTASSNSGNSPSNTSSNSGSSSTSSNGTSPNNSSQTNSGPTYKVVSGDTLEKIARKLYDKPDQWEKIYDLNKPLIGNNPHALKIGWVLKLPSAPTVVR